MSARKLRLELEVDWPDGAAAPTYAIGEKSPAWGSFFMGQPAIVTAVELVPLPVPDDAIGMCPNGHAMDRVPGVDAGWLHRAEPNCYYHGDVEVIGTRNRP